LHFLAFKRYMNGLCQCSGSLEMRTSLDCNHNPSNFPWFQIKQWWRAQESIVREIRDGIRWRDWYSTALIVFSLRRRKKQTRTLYTKFVLSVHQTTVLSKYRYNLNYSELLPISSLIIIIINHKSILYYMFDSKEFLLKFY